MKAFRRLSCLLMLMAMPLVTSAAPQAKPGGAIKVYPIAAGTAATVTPATELQRANQPLLVGVAAAPPFVIEDHGHYRGLAIALWEAVAADRGWKYEYRPYAHDALLDAVRDSKVDVGLGAIATTAADEQHMDFSHPILSAGLGVAVRGGSTAGWLAVTPALASPVFLTVVAALVLLLLVAGVLLWLLEYRRRPEPSGADRSLFSGFWWATAALTSVGGGDHAPRSLGGRIVGLVCMLAALADLAAGRVDAVVESQPLLHWDIRQHYRGRLKVLPLLLQRQDYAFALPAGSRLREPINVALLKRISAADWPQQLDRAFGGSAP